MPRFFTRPLHGLFLLMFALAACSDPDALTQSEGGTLRSLVGGEESAVRWTSELESSVLTQEARGADGVSRSVQPGPRNIFASGAEGEYGPVYPRVEGFAVLDTSALDADALEVLDGFCAAIRDGGDADAFMARGHAYALALFYYDVRNAYGADPGFGSYLLGQPFVNENVCQCPVRFFRSSASPVDVFVYLARDGGAWRVRLVECKE